ncbi:MAG: hypothetical protein EAZ51_00520 [Sphingobacteriales bacterium]|nr:MAG: hypothetical protein EAZ64_09530 [Sphingobacteriales bacterium]TAF83805.1 MAG: hypothetical protein EAZ51_00520 [Sphingobacteriales bacterium]
MRIYAKNIKNLITCLTAIVYPYILFASCDPETDPFCDGGDVDAPIDNYNLILVILSCILVLFLFNLRIKKKFVQNIQVKASTTFNKL